MEYINEICQGCGRKFADGDDVVVCPECGTPQHRECYQKENKCVNEHLHSDNYEWKPKHSHQEEKPISNRENDMSVQCPFCGHPNDIDAKMCENCGQPFEIFGKSILPERDRYENQKQENNDQQEESVYKPPFDIGEFQPDLNGYRVQGDEYEQATQEQQPDFAQVAFGGDIPEGETCGVSNRDIKLFVRNSPSAYYRKFKSIEEKKPTFNIGAFVFGQLWFFYRKLFKEGLIFMTIAICLSIAFYNPIISAYDEMSAIVTQVQQDGENADLDALSEQMTAVSEQYMPTIAAFVGLTFGTHIVMAFTADRFYKHKAVKEIKEVNEAVDGDDRRKITEFFKKGGSSFVMGIAGYFLQSMITSIITGVFFQ